MSQSPYEVEIPSSMQPAELTPSDHKTIAKARRSSRGMTTAEYAVGTVGAVTAGGVLIYIFQQQWFRDLLMSLIEAIIRLVVGIEF